MKGQPNPNNKESAEPSSEAAPREPVEKRAYHIWLAAGGGHGEHLRHWLQAESEVLKTLNQAKAERSLTRNTSARPKVRSSLSPNETISKE